MTEQRARELLVATQGDAVEQVAQFLHDEGGFDEAWSGHTWPEHADDTGQRDGGFVKIVPSDVQAKFRDVARRLLTMPIAAAPTPFAESAKSPSDRLREALVEIEAHDDLELQGSALEQHDRASGYAKAMRLCGDIARAALQSSEDDK